MNRPELVWLKGGYYSVGVHFFTIQDRVMDFFGPKRASSAP